MCFGKSKTALLLEAVLSVDVAAARAALDGGAKLECRYSVKGLVR